MSRSRTHTLALSLLLASLAASSARAQNGGAYGFRDFEIYDAQAGIFDLCTGDVNGDGLADAALVDNARSRVEVFLRIPAGEPERYDSPDEPSVNDVRYDGRFRRVSLPVELRVLQLLLADFDGDGMDDVVYATTGGEVALVPGESVGADLVVRKRRFDGLRAGCNGLWAADLDQDGKLDLLAAGEDTLLAMAPVSDAGLGDARVVDRIGNLGLVRVVDLDGRDGADLLYGHFLEDYPFRYRLRQPGGTLGPRVDVELPQVRNAEVLTDARGAAQILAVFKLSGRVARYRLEAEERAEGSPLSRYSLSEQKVQGGERTLRVGDLDGDGTADVVAAEPATAEVRVFSGQRGARVMREQRFPSLVGVKHPRIGDVDGDGVPELVVMSGPERMIGVTRFDAEGQLAFPDVLPLEGEPAAMDLADLDGDGRPDLAVISTRGEGRQREYVLETFRGGEAGFGEHETRALADLKKIPTDLLLADVDRDGRRDVIAFLPGDDEAPLILVRRDEGFVRDPRGDDAPGLGILGGARPARVEALDVDGDGAEELLVASGNFARALWFESTPEGALTPRVLEQFSGPAADSRITGCTAADLDGDGASEVVLRDERTHELLVLARDGDGPPTVRARIDAGRLRFAGVVPADADGDGRADLFVLGEDQFGVWFADAREQTLREVGSYEPAKERVYLDRLVVGDLDADGAPDVVATEAFEHALVILNASGGELEHGLGFRVFEEKTFSSSNEGREPRELARADFDGDGRDDLAVLVHDKLIVYLQE